MAKQRSRPGVKDSNWGGDRPGNPDAVVSGPGALSQRTDGAQPIMRGSGMAYGESQAYQEQQRAGGLGDSGGANMGINVNAAPPNVFAPTENPMEAAQSGAPLGPGLNQIRKPPIDNENVLLEQIAMNTQSPVVWQLLNQKNSEIIGDESEDYGFSL